MFFYFVLFGSDHSLPQFTFREAIFVYYYFSYRQWNVLRTYVNNVELMDIYKTY